eukprot:CAMPEP_0206154060 /NCGR_PEP_ID=MMETSP1474-20131121/1078_1 /ASSEMBLY_ACC=CAM_ASM_001110 /TAXON_ID=97495 /ORGANISM="Imantonia sp., Strain RCC918" /LENGTH=416 /DNA_ID=CAMNT_0053552101 /DNA_START=43 /DNA_END=1293 /DNA_ORIENTATION=-
MKVLALILLLVAIAYAQDRAVAVIKPTTNTANNIQGTVTFTENGNNVDVTVSLTGLSGLGDSLGIHIHTYGDASDPSGSAFGGHWVGAGSEQHGCPESTSLRHEGDTGSWNVVNGVISQTKTLDLISLSGSNSVIGRGVILHDIPDPCDSSSTGGRIGFGVIGLTNDETNTASQGTSPSKLVTNLTPTDNCPGCSGTLWFEDVSGGVRVVARVEGLSSQNAYGLHMHVFGDITDEVAGLSVGGHWNPDDSDHGLPPSNNRHVGDMGNIQSFDGNVAWYDLVNNKIPNTASIVGRGIVVHQLVDSGAGAGCVLGNSGSRYAIGTIGIADETLSIPNPPISINTNFVDQSCEIDYSSDYSTFDYTTIDTTRNVNDDDDSSSSNNNSSFNFDDDDSSSSDASIISSSIVALVTAFIAFF